MNPNSAQISLESMKAEIAQIIEHQNECKRCVFTEEQREILVHAIDSGMQIRKLSAWWKKQGWPGYSENTLRKYYREMKEGAP